MRSLGSTHKLSSGPQIAKSIDSLSQILKRQVRSASNHTIKLQSPTSSNFAISPEVSKPSILPFETPQLLIAENQPISPPRYSVLYKSNHTSPINRPSRPITTSHYSRNYYPAQQLGGLSPRTQAIQAIEEKKKHYTTLNDTVGPWRLRNDEQNRSTGNTGSFTFSLANNNKTQIVKVAPPTKFITRKHQRTEELSRQIKSYQASQTRFRDKQFTLRQAKFDSNILSKTLKEQRSGSSVEIRRSPKNITFLNHKASVPLIEEQEKEFVLEYDEDEKRQLEQLNDVTKLYKSLRLVYLVESDEQTQLRREIRGDIRPFICENTGKRMTRIGNLVKNQKRGLKTAGNELDSKSTYRAGIVELEKGL